MFSRFVGSASPESVSGGDEVTLNCPMGIKVRIHQAIVQPVPQDGGHGGDGERVRHVSVSIRGSRSAAGVRGAPARRPAAGRRMRQAQARSHWIGALVGRGLGRRSWGGDFDPADMDFDMRRGFRQRHGLPARLIGARNPARAAGMQRGRSSATEVTGCGRAGPRWRQRRDRAALPAGGRRATWRHFGPAPAGATERPPAVQASRLPAMPVLRGCARRRRRG